MLTALNNLTPEEFHVVWEALNQFVSNTEELEEEVWVKKTQIAEKLVARCDAEFLRETGA